jgi:hypothetical protein
MKSWSSTPETFFGGVQLDGDVASLYAFIKGLEKKVLDTLRRRTALTAFFLVEEEDRGKMSHGMHHTVWQHTRRAPKD